MLSRTYRYGLLPPVDGAEHIERQIRAGHDYYNRSVDAWRGYFAGVDSLLDAHGLSAESTAVRELEAALVESERNTPTRRELQRALSVARRNLTVARKQLRASEAVKSGMSVLERERKSAIQDARRETGVYYGTYLPIDLDIGRAIKMGRPSFRPWRGGGQAGAQIQRGMTTAQLVGCDDARARLDLVPQPVYRVCASGEISERPGKKRPRLWVRMGSTGLRNRTPLWSVFPLVYHRPLPGDARVKWVTVKRRSVGTRVIWEALLALELPDVEPRTSGHVVALDIGWRRAKDAPTTVAGRWSVDGAAGTSVCVPRSVLEGVAHADGIRSARDRHVDDLRASIVAWRDAHQDNLSSEHRERLREVGRWRSARRFVRLASWWAVNRCQGDEDVFSRLMNWRGRDNHLWDYESGTRRRALARRDDVYRQAASSLTVGARVLLVEDLNLMRLAERRTVRAEDDGRSQGGGARQSSRQRFATAPGRLREMAIDAARKRGVAVVTVPASSTTDEMFQHWRESRGVMETAGVARSSRVNELRQRGKGDGARRRDDSVAVRRAQDFVQRDA